MLLALGLVTLGLLLPVLPTGELGAALRGLLTGSIGWGAYALPWPVLALGGLFLLRKNPRSWPRLLAGYLLLALGLWLLLMLFSPASSGLWGERLRASLAGATGWLALVPALLVLSLGVELLLGWPPTRLARGATRRSVQAVRHGATGLLSARRRLKSRAAFGADVALAQRGLRDIDKDLAALRTLYPGSAELGKWRKAVAKTRAALERADEETLQDAQADLQAWQNAVAGFTQDRAAEFRHSLDGEALAGFEAWLRAMTDGLSEPFEEPGRVACALDDIRKTLLLDLTALAQRYGRLRRACDLAEGGLAGCGPRALVQVMADHQVRLQAYAQIAESQRALASDAGQLGAWYGLSAAFLRLQSEFGGAPELGELSARLSEALRARGRSALAESEGWRERLSELQSKLRRPGPVAGALEPDLEAEAEAESQTEAQTEAPPEAPSLAEAPDAPELEPGDEEAPEAPELAFGDASPSQPAPSISEAIVDEPEEGHEVDTRVGGIPIQLPGFELLDKRAKQDDSPGEQAREAQGRVRKIDETLHNFKLQGRVVSSARGPTVTRFEVEPAPGEKISRFATLSDDLALAMAVGSVRIEAPIPGKSVIGLEVPNAHRDLITFREAAESAAFRRSKARLPLILGKSIDGEMVVGDLAKMPHLLVAGSTGSGKSVAVNTLVGSLIYKFLPTELRFLMIDPKMVELTPYDGIPHLVRPVVTNPGDAAGVLLGTVAHMERRYKMMSKIGAKNLDQYNDKARNLDMPELPHMVIIIDELADLMITSPKEVESAIMRLAQMARATGMHLVLATQRPSVDILTSLIKVNVPARVAFAVSSGHDSRTILDTMGAERLTGQGDMLFYQPGLVKPARLQGPFISEPEIHNLAGFLRRQYFDDDFVEAYGSDFDPPPSDESSASGLIDWNDDKLREAAELVINEGQASVSRLQRRLGVGHARAGKLMDSLESLAVVGPHLGSKPREVLVTLEELPNLFGK